MTETEDRLRPCAKRLLEVCNVWEANGHQDAPILIAAATLKAAQIVRANDWPADEYSDEGAVEALIAAVESPPGEAAARCILAAVAALLGQAGRAAYLMGAQDVRASGETPMLAVMISAPGIVAATTLCVPRPTVH